MKWGIRSKKGVIMRTEFSEADIAAFKPTMKVGLLATVNDEGLPHLSLIATLQASSPTQLVWGQFTEGASKQFIRRRPQAGFLIMTMDKQLWRGQATFTHTAQQGPEYDAYNATPMFRYNAYFGVHTVYYMDLVAQTGQKALPMGRIVTASLQTLLARVAFGRRARQTALNPWTRALLSKLGNLKFLAYIGADGYPTIIPVLQAQTPDPEHVIFAASVYGAELRAIPTGTPVALFGMALSMEDVLVRGPFLGIQRYGGVACGALRVTWVYNSMPPNPQQIYPPLPLEPVTTF